MSFSALNALDRTAMRARLRELLALQPADQADLDRMRAAKLVMAGRNISDIPKPDMISAILILSGDHAEYTAVTRVAAVNQTAPVAAPMPVVPSSWVVTPSAPVEVEVEAAPVEVEALPAPIASDEDAAVEREVAEVRSAVMSGGFVALDDKIRGLVLAARKPAEVRIVQVKVPAAPVVLDSEGGVAVPQAALTGSSVTWGKAFGVRGPLASRVCEVWDGAHPDTPGVHPGYVWPRRTDVALSQLSRGRNVYLWGPAGSGKTEFCQQVAARLGRPFILISCDASTDAATLVGMTVPSRAGGVTFQPGQLVRAIQTPGAVICIDEPSVARPGALFVLQNVLTLNKALYIQETGQRVAVAPGVSFMATDNTNGTGGGSRRGYHGTQALNAATLDRFGCRIRMDWNPPAVEARILMAAVPGCTVALAKLLVEAANTTRAAAETQVLSAGLGLRRLFGWAELLVDGIDVETAFLCAVQDCVPEGERETLRQQCKLAVDGSTVRAALGDTSTPTPAPDTDAASVVGPAADFTPV